jgi:ABC-type transport system involved in multi-copper enzyme maturation permease subunit
MFDYGSLFDIGHVISQALIILNENVGNFALTGAILCIYLLKGEQKNRYFRNLFVTSLSRTQIYFGKFITILVATLIQYIVSFIILQILTFIVCYGGGSIDWVHVFQTLLTFLLSMVALTGYVSIIYLLSLILSNSGIYVAIVLFLDGISQIPFLILTSLNSKTQGIFSFIYPYQYFSSSLTTKRVLTTIPVEPKFIVLILVNTLFWVVICHIVGLFLFKKADLK